MRTVHERQRINDCFAINPNGTRRIKMVMQYLYAHMFQTGTRGAHTGGVTQAEYEWILYWFTYYDISRRINIVQPYTYSSHVFYKIFDRKRLYVYSVFISVGIQMNAYDIIFIRFRTFNNIFV